MDLCDSAKKTPKKDHMKSIVCTLALGAHTAHMNITETL